MWINLVARPPISRASTYTERVFREGTESRFWEVEWPKKETAVTVVSMTPCYCDGTAVTGMTPGYWDGTAVTGMTPSYCDGTIVTGITQCYCDGTAVTGITQYYCDGTAVTGMTQCYCDGTAVIDMMQCYCDGTAVAAMTHSVSKFRVTLHMFTCTQSKEYSNSRCQYIKQLKLDYIRDAVTSLIKWIYWAQAVSNGPSNTTEHSYSVRVWRIQAMSLRQAFNARYKIRKGKVKCLTDQHSYMARFTISHKQRNADLADLMLRGMGTQVKSALAGIRTRPQLERRSTVINMFSFNFHYRACHYSFFRMGVVHFNDIAVTFRFGRRMTGVWKTREDSEDLTDVLFQYLKKLTKALKSCHDSRCSCWDSKQTPAECTSTALPLRATRSLQAL